MGKMGRPSKYSEEIAARIIEVIEQCGSPRAAYESVNIPKRTYYDWVSRYPHFSHKIQQAYETFRMTGVPDDLVEKARQRLRELIEVGIVETFTKNGATLDAQGRVISRFVSETKINRGPSIKAIELVLGPTPKPLSEIEAMQQLVLAGMASPEQLDALLTGVEAIKERLRELNQANQKAIAAGNGKTVEVTDE